MRATLIWLGLLLGGSGVLHAQARLSTQDLASVRSVPVGASVILERMPVAIGREAAVTMKRIDVYAADARILVSDGSGLREIPRSDWLQFVSTPSSATKARLGFSLAPDGGTASGVLVGEDGLVYAIVGERSGDVLALRLRRARVGDDGEPAVFSCANDLEALPDLGTKGSSLDYSDAAALRDAKAASRSGTVAVDTDNEFMSLKFSNNTTSATNYLTALFTGLNVIYERDHDLTLTQGTTLLRVAADPYVASSTSDQLDEFGEEWAANQAAVSRAFAMLLSGKSPSANSAAGIAWVLGNTNYCTSRNITFPGCTDGTCTAGHYSVSQVFRFGGAMAADDMLVIAHELGHNFGANHAHCSNNVTGAGPTASSTIDQCFNGESGSGCYAGATSCPATRTINGVTNVQGTLMSYCHLSGIGGCDSFEVFDPAHVTLFSPRITNNVSNGCFVTAPNAAPTLDAIANPAAILEDAAAQVVNLTGITDGDASFVQTLSVAAASGNTGLIPNPSVTYTSANTTSSLGYTPVANQSGSALITVTVTDSGGTANGGVNTFQRTFTVNVSAVNDAPVLDASRSPALAAIAEDSGAPTGAVGTLVSSLVDFASPSGQVDNVTDVDSGALLGIAVSAADTTNGSWFYSVDGGTNWVALGAVTATSARQLAADGSTRLYFQPAANFSGTVASAITFRAWDRSSGTNGTLVNPGSGGLATAYSTATDTASIAVSAVNDAPVLDASRTPVLASISEDAGAPSGAVGTLVSALVDFASPGGQVDNVTDVDSGALLGISVTAAATANGAWHYSTNGGSNWSALGAVSDASARLLAADANTRIYFQPNANFNGSVTSAITFRAWDQTAGTNGGLAATSPGGGTTAFSSATDSADTAVSALNDAPVLDASRTPVLSAVNEDAVAPVGAVGTPVSALVDFASPAGQVDNVSDVDSGALLGIAITAADTANGSWHYSTNGGSAWSALGTVGATSARLLAADANTRVYFQPAVNFSGAISPALTFRAWDRSSGSNGTVVDPTPNGGTTAYSSATDGAGITVTAVNDPPVFSSSATVAAAENQTAVLTVTSTDVDGGAPAYSISGGVDAARFAITAGGVLTFVAAPNFEVPTDTGNDNVYDVTVQVSDGNGSTPTQAIAVTVTNVNEPPVFTSAATASVAENQTTVLTVTSSDVDGGAPTYSISGGADAARFAITSGGVLTFVTAPNFEIPTDSGNNNVYDVTVQASDGNGATPTQAIAVTVTNVNEPPVFTSAATASVAENQTSVLTVTSTDVDGGAPTYSISGGADAARFSITGGGVLTFVGAPNFEVPTDTGNDNVYDVTVQVSDGNGGTPTQAIAVTVTNANEAPVFTSAATASVAENQTAVLTVTSTDVDGGVPTYSISGGADAARFAITGGGVLTFVTAPNFENPTDGGNNNVYDVTVQASDGNGATPTQAIAVTVTDVNEAPGLVSPANATLAEDAPRLFAGADQIAVTEPDGDPLSMSLTVTHGVLALGSTAGLGSVTGDGSALLQISGSVVALNAALATLQYVPVADYHGGDALVLAISDGALPAAGSVTLVIAPVIDVAADSVSTLQDTPISFNVLTGTNGASADAFEGAAVLVAVTQGADGSVTFAADGGVTYTPSTGTSGVDTFTYTVASGGAEEVGGVSVNVQSANASPNASNLSAPETFVEDQDLDLVDIVGSDADGGDLTASLTLSDAAAGQLSVASAGSTISTYDADNGVWEASGPIADVNALLADVRFEPATDYASDFTIATRVDDGAAAVTGSKAMTATPINDAPTLDAIPDPAALPTSPGAQIVLLTGIGAGGGETGQVLSIEAVSDTPSLVPDPLVTYTSAQPTGALAYTPVPGQQGTATITVTVSDDGGGDDQIVRTFVVRVGDRVFANGFEFP